MKVRKMRRYFAIKLILKFEDDFQIVEFRFSPLIISDKPISVMLIPSINRTFSMSHSLYEILSIRAECIKAHQALRKCILN